MTLSVLDRTRNQTIERDSAWAAGVHRLTTHIDDVWLRDAGQWAAVNEALQDDGLEGFAAQVSQMRHRIRLAEDGGRRWYPRRDVLEFVSFGAIEYWTGSAWAQLILGKPTREGNVLTWDRPQFTLRIVVTWRTVTFDVVLKTSNAARRLRWPVSLTGLTRSGYGLISVSDGTVVGSITPPWAEDANGVRYGVATSIAGGYVEFTASLAGATFPVLIDPTLTTPSDNTIAAAYIESGISPDYNYGASTVMKVKSANNGLLKFDLSTLSGATLSSASLHLFASAAGWFDHGTLTCGRILSASGSWVEGTLTGDWAGNESCWNYQNRGASTRWAGDTDNNGGANAGCSVSGTDYSASLLSSTALGDFNCAAGYHWTIAWDLTALAAMVSANYGAVLKGSSGGDTQVASDDHATSGYRPYLVVVYTSGGGETVSFVPRRALMGVGL